MAQVLPQRDHMSIHSPKLSLFQQLQSTKTKQPPCNPLIVGVQNSINGPAARIKSKVDDQRTEPPNPSTQLKAQSSPTVLNVTEVSLDQKIQPLNVPKAHMCQRFLAQQSRAFVATQPAPITACQHTAEELYYKDKDWDGELTLCAQCNLPIGDVAYDGLDKPIHGECLAQKMLQDLKKEEAQRLEREDILKKARRVEYDIGWKMDHIPSNKPLLSELLGDTSVEASEQSQMMCLVLDKDDHAVRVAKTFESTAAVNLEYLSLALRARRNEGREPWFSLDPVAPKEICSEEERLHAMQLKRYVPEWLAGTSVGDVLFQADYHLKELSIGEADQPIVGMKSCFDYSAEEGSDDKWTAREWFLIRKAEIQVSEDQVVIPYVKMGVEAREQVCDADGLHDAPITRPDHPMVKYAESFSQNFDLIAERKSVFYHLRELAKACVMAKFLVDSNITLDETLCKLTPEPRESDSLEIPQLWNERFCGSKIQLNAGEFKRHCGPSKHGLYGGVAFGVDKFNLALSKLVPRGSGPVLAQATGFVTQAAPVTTRAPVAPVREAREARPKTRRQPPPRPKPRPQRPAGVYLSIAPAPEELLAIEQPEEPEEPPPKPTIITTMPTRPITFKPNVVPTKGVDLNLNQFDLSTPSQVEADTFTRSWSADCISAGKAFWSQIDEDETLLEEEDVHLLREVFNPNLSDRREEGDHFAPPGTACSYVEKLQALLKTEETIRHERKKHFLSTNFVVGDAGPLFPSSWTTSLEIERGRAPPRNFGYPLPEGVSLRRVPANLDVECLLKAAPEFEKCLEDGMKLRIYKSGTLEVRTIQEHGKSEVIGAVFSVRSSTQASNAHCDTKDDECVVKVTEYVKHDANAFTQKHGYYVVMETENGNMIVTGRTQDGKTEWEANPEDLEDRNSLARVIRSVECRTERVRSTIKDVKAYEEEQKGSVIDGRLYAQKIFIKAIGGVSQMVRANNIKAKTVANEREQL